MALASKVGVSSILPSTPTARMPHGKSTYILSDHPDTTLTKQVLPSVDKEAAWVKKGGKLYYGYKRPYLVAADSGLVVAVHTTAANVHDGQCVAPCLDQVVLLAGSRLLAAKGYCAAKNNQLLWASGLWEWLKPMGSMCWK